MYNRPESARIGSDMAQSAPPPFDEEAGESPAKRLVHLLERHGLEDSLRDILKKPRSAPAEQPARDPRDRAAGTPRRAPGADRARAGAGAPRMAGITLDSGALIGLERHERRMLARLSAWTDADVGAIRSVVRLPRSAASILDSVRFAPRYACRPT